MKRSNYSPPSFRAENNYRYYNDKALKRLIFIKRCRALDMNLKEIEEALIQLEKTAETKLLRCE